MCRHSSRSRSQCQALSDACQLVRGCCGGTAFDMNHGERPTSLRPADTEFWGSVAAPGTGQQYGGGNGAEYCPFHVNSSDWRDIFAPADDSVMPPYAQFLNEQQQQQQQQHAALVPGGVGQNGFTAAQKKKYEEANDLVPELSNGTGQSSDRSPNSKHTATFLPHSSAESYPGMRHRKTRSSDGVTGSANSMSSLDVSQASSRNASFTEGSAPAHAAAHSSSEFKHSVSPPLQGHVVDATIAAPAGAVEGSTGAESATTVPAAQSAVGLISWRGRKKAPKEAALTVFTPTSPPAGPGYISPFAKVASSGDLAGAAAASKEEEEAVLATAEATGKKGHKRNRSLSSLLPVMHKSKPRRSASVVGTEEDKAAEKQPPSPKTPRAPPSRSNSVRTPKTPRTPRIGSADGSKDPLLRPKTPEPAKPAAAASALACFGMGKTVDGELSATDEEEVEALPAGSVGLRNLGNTCFINAALQCLRSTPGLPLLDVPYEKGMMADAFRQLIYEMYRGKEGSVVDPLFLLRRMASLPLGAALCNGGQHDCQEVLRLFLDSLHDDLNRVVQKPAYEEDKDDPEEAEPAKADRLWQRYLAYDNSLITDLFGGQLQSSVTCHACQGRFTMYEPFWDLSLPLAREGKPGGGLVTWFKGTATSIQDCLQVFTADELLEGSESFYCKACKEHTSATKHMRIHRLPRILLLHIKRFKYVGNTREKLTANVTFPLKGLALQQFVSEEMLEAEAAKEYDLFAVSNHFGNLVGGHYTATCLLPQPGGKQKWWTFNDDGVSKTTSQSVANSCAYMLFYCRRD
ncbi:hypothetical protein WJX72_008998 [[Myrmecia] bisecta]|uniref:Ubiquitin carboxyl-terminal hydrolase n=1 Tax=[Myrmecia] bisecta TaxID=41462 RepID=A0AAW1PSX2_9CHLO